MSTLRTGLCSLAVVVAGVGLLAGVTHGFQGYTSESLLRLSVQQRPRTVPAAALQAADGRLIRLADLQGRWLVVGFMYTRCVTICSVQGGGFVQLQKLLRDALARRRAELVSISFDPEHDTPDALTRYQRRYGDVQPGWLAVRPQDSAGLEALLDAFGVKAIPGDLGGFEHNAAFNLVNPAGQLVAILDWDDPQAAARRVQAELAR